MSNELASPEVSGNEVPTLDMLVNAVNYREMFLNYVPSDFALEFINFIKLVNGGKGEENKSPLIHMHMLDQIVDFDEDLFVCFRGGAKTTTLHEYMYLYLAVFGGIPKFGEVNVAMYISDTIDNGVKSMRQNLEFRHNQSAFLQEYIPEVRFTDVRWEFRNKAGKSLCVRGFGASTGVRGFKEYGQRPTWAGFDDLMSDKNAESLTIVRDIKNIIYKAARQALHPKKRKIIWTGTPFNARDPLYQAAGTEAWHTAVYPVCDKFPCSEAEFAGAWEDRFPYQFVKKEYTKLLGLGEISAFNQELMLRIMSDEDRSVLDSDIRWFDLDKVIQNKNYFNFYITTDFATSLKDSADFSVLSVWAYNNVGDWLWVDGVVKRQLMDSNVNDLFRLAQMYRPQQVGIEISGQQKGFISWIQGEMMTRNIYFPLASDHNSTELGIRPNTNKLQRFNTGAVPLFKAGKIYFPRELRGDPRIAEFLDELSLASPGGFRSKHDDCLDTISMLQSLKPWKPTEEAALKPTDTGIWEPDLEENDDDVLASYTV